ncbi:hypothetical protein CR513_32074, partial [Mucuna pruriens]
MDARIGNEIGLELSDVDIDGAIEPEGGGEGGNDLGDEPVEVGVGGSLDVKGSPADVVDGFVVQQHGHVGVLKERVGRQDAVVGLHNRETLQQERSQTRTSASAHGVEHQEALQAGAVVGQLSDPVQAQIYDLFANCEWGKMQTRSNIIHENKSRERERRTSVVASGEVVGGVFLAGYELLGVEELAVGAGADFVNDGGFEIDEDGTGDVLAGSGLAEESVEGVVGHSESGVAVKNKREMLVLLTKKRKKKKEEEEEKER